jgi:phosphatidylglycerophosphate synthase
VSERPPVPLKSADAVWTVFVIDPLAVPLVSLVRDSRAVTPDRLSAGTALVALASAAAFASGRLWLGALLFQLSFLLDCMDGKLARVRGTRSAIGALTDVAADALRLAACATGLAVALSRDGALTVSGTSLAAALVCLYVGARVGVAAIAQARPAEGVSDRGRAGDDLLPRPTPLAVLRCAPRRAQTPGTSVDTEALAFTIGPLAGLPVAGLAIAVAVDLLYAVVFYVRASARTRSTRAAWVSHRNRS